ncbi:MAG: hypothetical protein KDD69_11770 [Bdellovibrionales bacterium]|nr:hypothetical protein [Bdellovibrionales bacterium]
MNRLIAYRLGIHLVIMLFTFTLCFATPRADTDVVLPKAGEDVVQTAPQSLQEWVPWVLSRHPEWRCSTVAGARRCEWPGRFTLRLKENGASFRLQVEVLRRSTIPLPGGGDQLPHSLKVSRNDAVAEPESPYWLHLTNSHPYLELARGSYTIEGELSWGERPREIPLPESYGIVTVENGPESTRREAGAVILEAHQETPDRAQLSLNVMRRIADGSPLQLETLLELRYSGQPQSIQFGRVLLDRAVPIGIQSNLPFQLAADGSLTVQAQPGTHQISISAVLEQPVKELTAPPSTFSAWPREEVWSWVENVQFRSIELKGATAVNADVTNLPPTWRQAALYLVPIGHTVTLNELRRGEDRQPENSLSLQRNFWLQLDGSQYVVRDVIVGAMSRGFRLDALDELELGRASVGGEPVLISEKGRRGFEIRASQVMVDAVSILPATTDLSAVGWNITAERVDAQLNLSPGWRLLHIGGAEESGGSWLKSWSLLDIFVLLLLVIGTRQFFGMLPAAIAFAALLLNHGEFLSPEMLFIHLIIGMVFLRLSGEATEHWQQPVLWFVRATYVAWLLQVLAFMKLQFTEFLYPQLEAGTRYRTFLQQLLFEIEQSYLTWILCFLAFILVVLAMRFVLRATNVWMGLFRGLLASIVLVLAVVFLGGVGAVLHLGTTTPPDYDTFASQSTEFESGLPAPQFAESSYSDQATRGVTKSLGLAQRLPSGGGVGANKVATTGDRVVQAGPAIPSWNWKRYDFTIPGPVAPDHRVELFLLPPSLTRVLSLVRPTLLLVLALLLARGIGIGLPARFTAGPTALLLLLLLAPRTSEAQFPDKEVLQELERRLEQSLCKQDQCATVERLDVVADATRLYFEGKIISHGEAAVLLPGPLDQLAIDTVSIDQRSTDALLRDEKGYLWARVSAGKHYLQFSAPLKPDVGMTLQFPVPPLHMSFSSEYWNIEGLLPSGAVKSPLRLTPKNAAPVVEERKTLVLPAWFHARREIAIGEETLVRTRVGRMGSPDTTASVRVPLLSDERITSGGVEVEGGHALVRFPSGTSDLTYESVLGKTAQLTLVASPSPFLSEEWVVSCSTFVSCSYSGLLPSRTIEDGKHAYVWQPFPNESVTVDAIQLPGAPGDSLTIDAINHWARWGTTSIEGGIFATVRATEQRTFSLTLPPNAEVKRMSLNNLEGAGVVRERQVSFLLNPGAHELHLSYYVPWSGNLIEHIPPLALEIPAYNVSLRASPPSDRWLVWTGGVHWGPAVLFWAKLFFVAALVSALARIGVLPLRVGSGALLALGLTTLPLVALAFPLAWLFILRFGAVIAESLSPVLRRIALAGFVVLTLITVALFYRILQLGLVLEPPMLVVGNGSSAEMLKWYVDTANLNLPEPWFLSLPMWVWRTILLLWSTWLAVMLIRWLKLAAGVTRSLVVAHHV